MVFEVCYCVFFYVVICYIYMILSGTVYRLVCIGYPNIQDGVKCISMLNHTSMQKFMIVIHGRFHWLNYTWSYEWNLGACGNLSWIGLTVVLRRWCLVHCTVATKCTIHFCFYPYPFLRKCFGQWVGPCNLLRQRSLWWLYPNKDQMQALIAWSRRSTDGWIPIDGIYCLWRFI